MSAIGLDILDIGSSKWNKYNDVDNLSLQQDMGSNFSLPAVENVVYKKKTF